MMHPKFSAFVAYRHTGEDPAELRPLLELVCGALKDAGVDTYCTFFSEEDFQRGSLTPRDIMLHAFATIGKHDLLFIVQTSENKSEGMLMEVGFCWGTNKPIVVAVKDDVFGTYVPDMATAAFRWDTPDDLRQQILELKFGDIVDSSRLSK